MFVRLLPIENQMSSKDFQPSILVLLPCRANAGDGHSEMPVTHFWPPLAGASSLSHHRPGHSLQDGRPALQGRDPWPTHLSDGKWLRRHRRLRGEAHSAAQISLSLILRTYVVALMKQGLDACHLDILIAMPDIAL
jgi:hypothetical protein